MKFLPLGKKLTIAIDIDGNENIFINLNIDFIFVTDIFSLVIKGTSENFLAGK